MKKVAILTALAFTTVFMNAYFRQKSNAPSYDLPMKCRKCGQWHIPGTPCPKS